jgi:5-formyltetrahydrofolate cyclo-ligase
VTTPSEQGDQREQKTALRASMRSLRRSLPDRADRSVRIWTRVEALPEFAAARVVMAFTSVVGEPETAEAISRWRAGGRVVVVPEDSPDPSAVDLVIVPGVAFTPDGHRLGQGGGWYDRFLAGVRPGTPTVGVCFDVQVVPSLPVEPHDVHVDRVVSG